MMRPGTIRLYIMRTDSLDDPGEHEEWEAELPAGRWQKAVLPLRIEDRRNSAGAGWLLRYVFEKEGVPFVRDSVTLGPHGKPCHEALHFNLSHSGRYVICAVGEGEIGCDIQKIRPCRESMVRRFFAPDEQEYILSVQGKERDERFILLWSRKESFLKMTGEGLTREPGELSCLSGTGFYERRLEEYMICVCCSDAESIREREVSVEYVDAVQCLRMADNSREKYRR